MCEHCLPVRHQSHTLAQSQLLIMNLNQLLENTHIQRHSPKYIFRCTNNTHKHTHTHPQARGCSSGFHASDWNTCTAGTHKLLGSGSVRAAWGLGYSSHLSLSLSLTHTPTPSLSNPPAFLLSQECHLALRASLKSNAVCLHPPFFPFSLLYCVTLFFSFLSLSMFLSRVPSIALLAPNIFCNAP